MTSPAPRAGAPRRVPRPLLAAALAVLLLYPLAAGFLLLTSDGWAVNRANVRVWIVVTDLLGARGAITPEQFAMVANVMLFVPFFAALAILRPTWWWVLLGAGISTAVELYQGTLGSRLQDPWDIAANTLGAALGVALGLGIRRFSRRRRPALSGAAADATAPTTPGASPAGSADAPDGGPDDRG